MTEPDPLGWFVTDGADGDRPAAVGMVLTAGRGSLPFALLHGEPLVRLAAVALEHAGVEAIDPDATLEQLLELVDGERAEALVLHDATCPMTSPAFIAAGVLRAVASGETVVAFRPVTDTVKVVQAGLVGATVDRSGLRALASPVVLPRPVLSALTTAPSADLGEVVAGLVAAGRVVDWVEAPAAARRVGSEDDVRLLAALTTPAR